MGVEGELGEASVIGEGLSRRSALKRAGLAVGAAAFATPLIDGIFAAPAFAQQCDPNDSDSFTLELTGQQRWNANCGGGADPGCANPTPNLCPDGVTCVDGRWNGQVRTFTFPAPIGDVTFDVGDPGNPGSGQACIIDPEFVVVSGGAGVVCDFVPVPDCNVGPPTAQGGCPSGDCNSSKLGVLVTCCIT